jgi:hypothetical protein
MCNLRRGLGGNWSVCERSNRTPDNAVKAFGYPTAELFGEIELAGIVAVWGCGRSPDSASKA